MARKVYELDVEIDGTSEKFHYRKPSGAMMLRQSDRFKANKLSNEQSTTDLLAECIVNPDGTPISKERVAEILDMDWDVLQKINATLLPPTAKKDDDAKNA